MKNKSINDLDFLSNDLRYRRCSSYRCVRKKRQQPVMGVDSFEEQGGCSGYSTRLPPKSVQGSNMASTPYVGGLSLLLILSLALRGFSPSQYTGFPLFSKTNTSKF